MRIALVHDYLNQYGGAERVLEAFLEIFPYAPLYTIVYDEKLTGGTFRGKNIKTSFLQKTPFSRTHHQFFLPFMPMAVEGFDMTRFDVVLSDSASFAKGIITKPHTFHISYCHTPLRWGWDKSHEYLEEFPLSGPVKFVAPILVNYLRIWDKEASLRVDKFIANSNFVRKRILKYYGRDSNVIYPPVNVNHFKIKEPEDYFLMVGRLTPYKKFELGVKVFNELGWKLVIIGDGPDKNRLKKLAKKNIDFVGFVPDNVLREYYSRCKALIFPQEEDFGITPLEAMASGRPVIVYRAGGALETVIEGKTGVFFDEQTPGILMEALRKFDYKNFDPEEIRNHALKFDKAIFKEKIKEFIEKSYQEFKDKNIKN